MFCHLCSCSGCMCIVTCVLQTEKMLELAEAMMGKYVWGQYDLLVLPPSFPFGGRENPCLTFVTPTLLVSSYFPSGSLWLLLKMGNSFWI